MTTKYRNESSSRYNYDYSKYSSSIYDIQDSRTTSVKIPNIERNKIPESRYNIITNKDYNIRDDTKSVSNQTSNYTNSIYARRPSIIKEKDMNLKKRVEQSILLSGKQSAISTPSKGFNKDFFGKEKVTSSKYDNIFNETTKPTIMKEHSNNNNLISYGLGSIKSKDQESEYKSYLYRQTEEKPIITKDNNLFIGLDNLGNTCFMNTSLQLLLNCKEFTKEFIKSSVKTGVSSYLLDFIKEYNLKSKKSISPRDFKRKFESIHPMFSGYNQQDSQEFLRILIDDISKETNRVRNKPNYVEIKDKGKSKELLFEEYKKFYLNRDSSIVTDYFNGMIINNFKCESCSFTAYSFEVFMEIPIYLGKFILLII